MARSVIDTLCRAGGEKSYNDVLLRRIANPVLMWVDMQIASVWATKQQIKSSIWRACGAVQGTPAWWI